MRSIGRQGVLLCLLGLVAGAAWSQPLAKDTLSDWNSRLQSARTHLLAGEHRQALEIAVPLQREMTDGIQNGPSVGSSLAIVVLSRALAEAGTGDMEAAAWDWYVAQALDPAVAEMDLAPFGTAGAAVKALGRVPPPQGAKPPPCALGEKGPCSGAKRPRKIAGLAPGYPEGLVGTCAQGAVVIQTVIDEQGVVRHPVLKESPNPLMALSALEWARSWRFQPASYQGKAVKVFYTLTVNFGTSGRCVPRH